ncbi:hypothetical protein ACHHYP_13168 [Achlya hypogyna]|uniref:Hook C-terminal domain-containing protein n=1 Tax=Achlya hypogyna TaxID=1202772 RepID=A0A1V9ZFV1_ACHHY|nr:hypothetical protein ACHHYP_13168 [Achlya hypogyna]
MERLWEWVAFYAPTADARLSDCVSAVLRAVYPEEMDVAKEVVAMEWHCPIVVLNRHARELRMTSFLRCDDLPSLAATTKTAELGNKTIEDLDQLLRSTCIAAFLGSRKEVFVQDIMQMSPDVQEVVYGILTEASLVSAGTNEPLSPRATPNDADAPSTSPPTSAGGDNRSSSSMRSEMQRLMRENTILKEENASLLADVDALKADVVRLEADGIKRDEDAEKARLQMDVDMAKHERALKDQYRDLIKQLQGNATEAQEKAQALSHAEAELGALKDEVDVLRATAAKTAKLEARLEKYMLKIEELPRLKECNKRLEDKNHELADKVEQQDAALQRLQAVHRKLEEAKAANTAMAVQLAEMEATQARRDAERAQLAIDLEAARQEAQLQLGLKCDLQKTLAQLEERPPEATPSERLELDHDMYEKMDALQHENSRLKTQLSAEAADRVDALLEELDAITRVKKTFETKFFEARDALDATRVRLDEVQATKNQLEGRCQLLQDENAALTVNLENAHDRFETGRAQWTQQLTELERELTVLLDAKTTEAEALVVAGAAKDATIATLQAAVQARDANVAAQQAALASLQDAHATMSASEAATRAALEAADARLSAVGHTLATTQEELRVAQAQCLDEQTEAARLREELLVEREASSAASRQQESQQAELMAALAVATNSHAEVAGRLETATATISVLELAQHDLEAKLHRTKCAVVEQQELRARSLEAAAMLAEDVATTRQQLAAARGDAQALTAAHAAVVRNLHALQTEHDAMTQKWTKDQTALLEAQGTLREVHESLIAAEDDGITDEETCIGLKERVAKLKAKTAAKSAVEAQASALSAELAARTTELDDVTGRLCLFEKTVAQLRGKEAAGMKYVRDLVAKHGAALGYKTAEIAALEARIARVEAKNRVLEKERPLLAQPAERDPEMAKHMFEDLHSQLSTLRTEFQALHEAFGDQRTVGRSHGVRRSWESCSNCDGARADEDRRRLSMASKAYGGASPRRLMPCVVVQDKTLLQHKATAMAHELKLLREKCDGLQLREARRTREKENKPPPSPRPKRSAIDMASPPASVMSSAPERRPAASPSLLQLLSPVKTRAEAPKTVEAPPSCNQQ